MISHWEMAVYLLLTAIGYFCAGWLYGMRDTNARIEQLRKKMARIYRGREV